MRARTESVERGVRRLLVHRAFEFQSARPMFDLAVFKIAHARLNPNEEETE